jgi:hypothetical protein
MTTTEAATESTCGCDITIKVRNDAGDWDLFICGGEAYHEADDGTIVLIDLADFEFNPVETADWDYPSGTEMLVEIWDANSNLISSAVKVLP